MTGICNLCIQLSLGSEDPSMPVINLVGILHLLNNHWNDLYNVCTTDLCVHALHIHCIVPYVNGLCIVCVSYGLLYVGIHVHVCTMYVSSCCRVFLGTPLSQQLIL